MGWQRAVVSIGVGVLRAASIFDATATDGNGLRELTKCDNRVLVARGAASLSRGYSIIGPGATTSAAGIWVEGGFGPVVKNGLIGRFGAGIFLMNNNDLAARNLRVVRNGQGIRGSTSSISIRGSYINENYGDGIS